MSRIGVIVAPVDFSQSSTEALSLAASWAEQFGSELHVLHIVPDPRAQMWSVEAIDIEFAALTHDWVQKAEGMLVNLVSRLPISPQRLQTRVQVGRPAEQIVAYAKEHDAGLIIMPSGEHGRLARFLLGSVADYVVRAATCPVLILPVHEQHASVATPSSPAHAA